MFRGRSKAQLLLRRKGVEGKKGVILRTSEFNNIVAN